MRRKDFSFVWRQLLLLRNEPGAAAVADVLSSATESTFLTHTDQAAPLPNSRQLMPGTNVTFDDSVANERTVNAAAGSGITQLTGDGTAGPGSGSQALTLAATAVTPGTYGDATNVPQLTVDAKGRLTAVVDVPISGGSGITQLTADVTAGPGSGSQPATIAALAVTAAKLAADAVTTAKILDANVTAAKLASDAVTTVKVANDAVTYAKIQNVSAADLLLGRGNGGGAGDAQEIALGTNLSLSGTTLNAASGGAVTPATCDAHDDFVHWLGSAAVGVGNVSWLTGTFPLAIAGEASHPGIIRLSVASGTTNTLNANLVTGVPPILPSDTFTMYWVVRPNGHANASYRFGLYSTIAVPPVNGIYIEGLSTDTNWFLVTRAGSVETRVDTGIAIVAGTWYQFVLTRDDASTIGATVNAGSHVTSTTNIPTAAAVPFGSVTSVTGTQTIDIDYYSFSMSSLTRF